MGVPPPVPFPAASQWIIQYRRDGRSVHIACCKLVASTARCFLIQQRAPSLEDSFQQSLTTCSLKTYFKKLRLSVDSFTKNFVMRTLLALIFPRNNFSLLIAETLINAKHCIRFHCMNTSWGYYICIEQSSGTAEQDGGGGCWGHVVSQYF